LERFVRCRHCNLPHLASVLRCPFSGQAVNPLTRLPGGVMWIPSRDDLTGTVLDDRYMLGKRIGDGAMGSVYRSEHLQLGTTVAVKVLHSRFESGSAAEKRFLREGQSAGRIDHPNVVRIFDVGRLPDGAPYIVMEHLEGQELSKLLDGRSLGLARVVDLASQLLDGLAQAHAERVVHRDVKPDNLFLTREGGDEVLKILDFSIAKDQAASALTSDGDVLGTPHYLAPEQAMSKSVDARVDLWATAVVVYEMLTGRPPFEGESFPQLVMRILTDTPEPPSSYVAGLPPEVDAFFVTALAKEPAERFQSAESMRAALIDAFGDAVLSESSGDVQEALASTADRLDMDDTLLD
jgi:eukaryotic-like serine/threonine-protein kinase